MFEKPVSSLDKTLLRVIFTLFALILVFSIFSMKIGKNINNKIAMLEEGISNSDNELKKLDQEIYQIESYTNIYETVVNGETSAKTVNVKNQSRTIAKNALPNTSLVTKVTSPIPKSSRPTSMRPSACSRSSILPTLPISASTANKSRTQLTALPGEAPLLPAFSASANNP